MEVERRVVFDKDDRPAIRRIVEACNEARAFIPDEEMKEIEVLASGNPIAIGYLNYLYELLDRAKKRVESRAPHGTLLTETKAAYLANLGAAMEQVGMWIVFATDPRNDYPPEDDRE